MLESCSDEDEKVVKPEPAKIILLDSDDEEEERW